MNLALSDRQRDKLRNIGNLMLSYLLLVADFVSQCLLKTWGMVTPFIPWLTGLIAFGVSLGFVLVSAGYVIAKWGQVLAVQVSPLSVAFVWGLAAMLFASAALGKLMLRATGYVTMNLSSALQDTAAQVARLASASERRRSGPRPTVKQKSEPGEGEFVPWNDEMAFQNEMAEVMRKQNISEENIAETLRQSGRTLNIDESEGNPLG